MVPSTMVKTPCPVFTLFIGEYKKQIYTLRRIYIYAPLRIECGRWRGLERAERTCGECDLGKVEDVQHWLLECERWKDERVDLFQSLSRVALGFDLMTDDDKLFAILDQGCKHHSILKIILKMWTARFS